MIKLVSFIAGALGKFFNPDNAHGYQCKDLIDAICLALWGNWVDTVRPGNGQDVYRNANPAYFTKVPNDPGNPNQLPTFGSILSYAGSTAVPEGHTCITISADSTGVNVLQMDGYRQTPAHYARLSYDGLIGWLVPILGGEGVQLRKVTQEVAWVRTGPGRQFPLAEAFPEGISRGADLAVIGETAGEDPYQDGNNAWYITRSGYYVWANAAQDNVAGLVHVG